MRKFLLLNIVLVICCFSLQAQPASYTPSNAHSHNDYQNADPFHAAYTGGFGSLEADIFLNHDSLLVGHTTDDLVYRRTLENLYLTPLLLKVKMNNGYPYKDPARELQLLIDIKTEPITTLQKLITVLKAYPALISSPGIKFVITGRKPDMTSFESYPDFIWFDGELGKEYTKTALKKIVMLSGDFKNYSSWNGKGNLTEE
ncbi:MAG: Alkaline phosphatase, partial [Chitinophagaceae bacterium]|nr:Alkaline phosphatase [Chitinophagaceae bacterium]